MSFFKKVFGSIGSTDNAATERGADLGTALSLHLDGDLDPALKLYLTIAVENPDDILAPFLAAAIKTGKGQIVEAVETLRSLSRDISSQGNSISQAIALDLLPLVTSYTIPAAAEIIVTFAEQLKQEAFLQEAAVCFEIAAGLVPDNANVLHKFGDTLHDLRMYEYAESVLQEALKQAPNHWGSLYTYAVLLQDLQRDEEAISYYEKAVRFHPGHAKCRNNYGAALLRTNRLEEALEQCTIAAGLDPTSALVKVNLGNVHLLMGQLETARTSFAEAISLNENLPAAHYGLGRVEELLGSDPARARESYMKAVHLDPSLAELTLVGNPVAN